MNGDRYLKARPIRGTPYYRVAWNAAEQREWELRERIRRRLTTPTDSAVPNDD